MIDDRQASKPADRVMHRVINHCSTIATVFPPLCTDPQLTITMMQRSYRQNDYYDVVSRKSNNDHKRRGTAGQTVFNWETAF